jgi:pyruvate dehydrogenase E1 component beta subunit
MRDAINEALHLEMARDPRVIVLGEDVSGGAGGTSGQRDAAGGVFGVTKGLLPKFGEDRVIDTPISESAIIGAANGAALAGMRPVAELMFADFLGVCFDQVFNQAAKFRYMFGGKTACPIVIRTATGAGMNMGAQHSQSMYALVTAVPGLKVVVPSNAYDAKGLMLTAIRDDDPVVFFEHKALYPRKCAVPEGDYTIPFGEAALVREGEHVTVVAIGRMVSFAEKALDALAADGITADLIDPRTLSPLDDETIYESLENTGRLVIIDESPPRCSVASDIAALVASNAFHALKAPIVQITSPPTRQAVEILQQSKRGGTVHEEINHPQRTRRRARHRTVHPVRRRTRRARADRTGCAASGSGTLRPRLRPMPRGRCRQGAPQDLLADDAGGRPAARDGARHHAGAIRRARCR